MQWAAKTSIPTTSKRQCGKRAKLRSTAGQVLAASSLLVTKTQHESVALRFLTRVILNDGAVSTARLVDVRVSARVTLQAASNAATAAATSPRSISRMVNAMTAGTMRHA
jgi:hypothetical protein